MFDRLEIRVLPQGPRFAPQLRFWINGEDVVAAAVLAGGRGPYASDLLPGDPDRPGPLAGTAGPRRVELGEPECTGGCCGFLSLVVQRLGGVVQWSDWEVPADGTRPLEYHFDAVAYDAELASATTESALTRRDVAE
ncbi:hypothetical protein ACFW1A_32065 [Kitasatospora sp. NPDC058965]|uniref:hypothetical protein n=1 Tax=Kitasatospora sp. NPDC058965 TaxID=3346682 RepID=UPI0036B033CD